MQGDNTANFLEGTSGNDTLIGLGGEDTLEGGAGNDSLDGGADSDTLRGGTGNDTLVSGEGNDFVEAGDGDDLIDSSTGTAATDFWGDYIRPGLGEDTILGNAAVFAARDGIDIGYTDVTTANGIILTVGANGTGTVASFARGEVRDNFTYAHRFDGTPQGDSMTGSDNSNWEGWGGGGGDDTIDGAGGYDELLYHHDAQYGGAGAINVNFATGVATDGFGDTDTFSNMEAVRATAGADVLTGSADIGFLSYRGLGGNDTITGTSSEDRADYSNDANYGGNAGIVADLAAGTIVDGFGDTDTVSQIDIVRGTDSGDSITGGDADERLEGEGGNDTLNGGGGFDSVYGGDGDDYLNPGDNAEDWDLVIAGRGNDTVDFGDMVTGGGGVYHWDLDAGIDVDVDVGSNTFTVDKGVNGTTTVLDMQQAVRGWGAEFGGSAHDDSFAVALEQDTYNWMNVIGGQGTDTYALDYGVGNIRMSFNDSGVSQGLVMDIGSGTIANDGFGNAETFTVTGDADRSRGFEVRGTYLDDSITGSDKGETFILERGNDTVDGGGGSDRLRYDRNGVEAVTVDLAAGTATGIWEGAAFSDTLSNIEQVIGSRDDDDVLSGDGQDNYLRGRGGDDTLRGLDGDDTLRDDDGNDRVEGGDGDDTIIMGSGADYFDGGAGRDLLEIDLTSFAAGDFVVTIDMLQGTISTAVDAPTNDRLFNVEDVEITGEISNAIIGNGADNSFATGDGQDTLQGGNGDDMLNGGGGDDTLQGDGGNDSLYGGSGLDRAIFADQSDAVTVTAAIGGLTVASTQGTDFIADDVEEFVFADTTLSYAAVAGMVTTSTVSGTDNAENVNGTDASEVINAGGGSDWITPGAGSDTIDGGDGRDMVSFVTLTDTPGRPVTTYRLTLDLETGIATTSGGETYQLSNVERVTGTVNEDYMRGTAGDDELRLSGAYDWVVATTGADHYDGGQGSDMVSYLEHTNTSIASASVFDTGAPLSGSAVTGVLVDLSNPGNNVGMAATHSYTSIERITGSSREDVFWGDGAENDFRGAGGYDWFVGSTGGRERYFGGTGVDTVTYFNSTSAVSASLINGAMVNGMESGRGSAGDAASDLYFEIENLVGTAFDDTLTGNSGRNELNGLDGNDMLDGRGGTDRIMGGAGNDTIDGGGGSDYAIFSGNAADYTLDRISATEVNISGADGMDELHNVEYFVFDDAELRIWDLTI